MTTKRPQKKVNKTKRQKNRYFIVYFQKLLTKVGVVSRNSTYFLLTTFDELVKLLLLSTDTY